MKGKTYGIAFVRENERHDILFLGKLWIKINDFVTHKIIWNKIFTIHYLLNITYKQDWLHFINFLVDILKVYVQTHKY